MMNMIRTACILAVLSTVCVAHAQVVTRSTDTVNSSHYAPVKPKGPKPISHEISCGIRINSDGGLFFKAVSLFADIGKVKNKDAKHPDMFYNLRFWEVEFTEKVNPKEYRSTGQGGSSNNHYFYGKINNFYSLKVGRGFTRMIAGKPDPGSVSIHWVNAAGIAIGLLKPYYLNVFGDPNGIKYTDGTKEEFLDQTVIEGSAGIGKGIGEIKVIPGAHIKSAVHFDFSANRKTVVGVETGLDFEYYSQEVQLMANQPGTSYFGELFISLQVGKRW